MVKFAVWATGVVPSAPRVTVQVVPDTLVTAISSDARIWSATWNWVIPVAAGGKDAPERTVHVSLPPLAGAVVPPEVTVVEGRFAKFSIAATAHPQAGTC